MEKRDELYRGKAKTVYYTDDSDKLILHFRNDTSAFDGEKIEQLERKGEVTLTKKLGAKPFSSFVLIDFLAKIGFFSNL